MAREPSLTALLLALPDQAFDWRAWHGLPCPYSIAPATM
jgi:hypothetical protein